MKLFGSLRELVAVIFRKDSQEITVKPSTAITYDEDIELELPPIGETGETSETLVGEAAEQTLTNKTLTSPDVNEAVTLTATSTELNQLSGVEVGGPDNPDILTIDATQAPKNKNIDADFNTISNFDHGDLADDPTTGVHGVGAGAVVGTTLTQTLEDKTLDAATVGGASNNGTDGFSLYKDQSGDPAAPSGDDVKLYAKDGKLYQIDVNDVPIEVGSGAGGSGEKNYIGNPSGSTDVSGWLESSDGAVDIDRSDTAAELPRENTTGTGLKVVGTAAATGEYVSYDFNLDESDLGKLLKIRWDQKPVSGYTAGDFEVVIYDVDEAAEIVPAVTEVPEFTGTFQTTFVTDAASTNYELRIKSTVATSAGVVISDIIVGPGSQVQVPDSRWPSYDDTEVSITGYGDLTTPGDGVTNASLVPYQDSEGGWRLRFNLLGSLDIAATSVTITITSLTFPYYQAISVSNISGTRVGAGYVNSVSNAIVGPITTGTSSDTFALSGDVEIDTKPTWADKVAPDIYLSGMPDTDALGGDWKDWIPEITNGGTTSTNVGKWRRNGDSFEGMITTIYTGAGSGFGLSYALPNSYVMDSAKLNGSTINSYVGNVAMYDASTADQIWGLATPVGGYTGIQMYMDDDSGSLFLGNQLASGDYVRIHFVVPIQGWTTQEYLANAITGFNIATPDKVGLVKKNRVQTETLTSDVSDDGADFLEFTGLTVGKIYTYTAVVSIQFDSDNSLGISIREGTTDIKTVFPGMNTATTSEFQIVNLEHTFTATETSIKLRTSSWTTGTVRNDPESWATLKELNNYEVTTAW